MFQPDQAAAVARHLVDPDLITLNLLASFLIEKAKNSRVFPFITQKTRVLNKIVAAAASLAAAVGVHFATGNPSSGVYVITVSGLTMGGIVHAAFDWLKSFVAQEIIYQRLIRSQGDPKKDSPG